MAAVAPMDLVMRGDAGSIPLQCTICPKKPKFSDLSHLLTHISSKSHLAHRFRAELRARDDRIALEEVRQYDSWCERYGINALLAERMAAKERKKGGGRRGRPVSGDSKADTPAGSNGFVKTEPDDYTLAQCSTQWTPIPAPYHHGHHDPFDVVGYPTPSLKRSRSDNSDPVTPENDMHPKPYRRWPSETATTDSANPSEFTSETTELDEDNDSSKLKGIKYPGMGLFDSADENQRRMRNQRKDDSVLKQMEETSSGIAPNEMVLTDGTLEFQRFRDIYASPSVEGTPDRELEEDEERKPKRGRRANGAAPKQVRTRASTRLTRQTNKTKNKREREEEDDDVRASGDGYDIFRDTPTANPMGSPHRAHGYELRRRAALQPVNKKMVIGSASEKQAKSTAYMASREAGTGVFSSQPPVPSAHYFHSQHSLGPGTFNPLNVQARGYYNPYAYSNFSETKPSPATFQAMSSMNLGNMPFSSFTGHFTSDAGHEGANQYDDL